MMENGRTVVSRFFFAAMLSSVFLFFWQPHDAFSQFGSDYDLSTPERTVASAGEMVTIPLNLTNNTAKQIQAFGLRFNYPAALLTFMAVDKSGTLTDSFIQVGGQDSNPPGQITIGGFDFSGGTTGAGVLLNVIFTVKDTTGIDTLRLSNFSDDLATATTTDGVFEIPSALIFTAILNGDQEVPPVVSTGHGEVTAALTGDQLVVTGSFQNLSSNFNPAAAGGSHLHTAPAGRNGGITIPLMATLDGDMRGGTFEAANNTFTLTSEQLAALAARQLYANVHTVTYGSGEIRGQMLPQSDAYFRANLSGSNENPPVRSPGNGTLVAELRGDSLVVSGSFKELGSDFNPAAAGGSHLHMAYAGSNGGISIGLTPTLDADNRGGVFEAANNAFTLTSEQATALSGRRLYANIHTTTYGAGEVRGQVVSQRASSFRTTMASTNEVPPIATAAAGGLVLELEGDTLQVSGSFSGLSSDFNPAAAGGSHLHLAAAGSNGGIQVPLVPTLNTDQRGGVFEITNNSFILTSEQSVALRARRLYANIHTIAYPGGELRGQVLPNSYGFFVAYLAGINEVQPVASGGRGGVIAELSGTRLIVTGSFSGLSSDFNPAAAGGSHLHLAAAGSNGGISVPLTATVAADLRSGSFEAADNAFTLTTEQVTALRGGNFYANVHTTAAASGEVRGQVLNDPNRFPGASSITSPPSGATVDVSGSGATPFEVMWNGATDPNGDLVVYGWQLASDEAFTNLLVQTNVGTSTSFQTDYAGLDALLETAGAALGDTVTLYHRVFSSDGSLWTFSATDSANFVRGGLVIAIAEARAAANGESVTVEGIVTRAFGRLTRIQDASAGIVIFQSTGSFSDAVSNGDVAAGDLLRVSGTLTEFSSLKQFSPVLNFQVLSRGNPLPDAQVVTLADLAASGEDYESELIVVDNLIVDAAGDTAFRDARTYPIQDPSDMTGAVTLRTASTGDTDIAGTPIPLGPFTFEGVLGQFSSSDPATGYQLQIVLQTDVMGGQLVSISDARGTANGETVTVQGIVTRAFGRFTRIQDETGGIVVFQTSGSLRDAVDAGEVRQGDLLRATGAVTEFSALKEITPVSYFTVVSRDNALPAAPTVTLAEIAANGEAYESELIRVETITIDLAGDDNFVVGKTYQITDASDQSNAVSLRTPSASDTDIGGRAIPSVFNFEGVLTQFSSTDPAVGYQLQAVLTTDIEDLITGIKDRPSEIPKAFALYGSYPNPFNPSTAIVFDLPTPARVSIEVYDLQGRKVLSLPTQSMPAGAKQTIVLDASVLSTGTYFYKLAAEGADGKIVQQGSRFTLVK